MAYLTRFVNCDDFATHYYTKCRSSIFRKHHIIIKLTVTTFDIPYEWKGSSLSSTENHRKGRGKERINERLDVSASDY